ncbi:DUF4123 domain-containing protein [Loktanella sp. F6476L]|uniref:DUF4123 domain-containing protein n=1 Tax=Loktanella sp. F6476L TaxID=2926405 RepID=UPI001FF3F294|nr:DUF4123 domain-containing protein [Loktanella sp. F6476L]MCK0122443.1 DUF4123 domain-containing protein [Loktanella sp. F6476L]
MWRGTCVYETLKDRYVLETSDPSQSVDAAAHNRRVFVDALGGRMIIEGPLENDLSVVANPALVARTNAVRTDPLRLDLILDRRSVLHDKVAIPDGPAVAFQEMLFGSDVQSLESPFDTSADVEVFALIDAALDPMMPEMLEGSGLDHVCLFSGKAERELSEVAPWLVRLTADHPLTTAFLDVAAPPVGLWPLESAVLFCSRIGLPGLRRHLRNFTRLEGEPGAAPTYFRFYAPSVLRSLLSSMTAEASQQLFAGIDRMVMPAGKTPAEAVVVSRGAV